MEGLDEEEVRRHLDEMGEDQEVDCQADHGDLDRYRSVQSATELVQDDEGGALDEAAEGQIVAGDWGRVASGSVMADLEHVDKVLGRVADGAAEDEQDEEGCNPEVPP